MNWLSQFMIKKKIYNSVNLCISWELTQKPIFNPRTWWETFFPRTSFKQLWKLLKRSTSKNLQKFCQSFYQPWQMIQCKFTLILNTSQERKKERNRETRHLLRFCFYPNTYSENYKWLFPWIRCNNSINI